MSLLLERKSIRNFTDKVIEKELVTKMLQAAMQAPSANNQQPWEFIIVDDRSLLDQLSQTSRGAWMLKDVKLAIVPLILKGDKSPHFAVQDLSAATENILLEATNQGIGSVWIGVYPLEDRIRYIEKILNISGDKHPFSMIALGYPKHKKETRLRYDESRIHYNKLEE